MNMTKRDRLILIYERLSGAEHASSGEEAFDLLSRIVDSIEDEFTEIPNVPENYQSDGRIYPPQRDNRRVATGHANVIRYRTVAHNVFVGSNGALEIQVAKSGTAEFEKPGRDGRRVWELNS